MNPKNTQTTPETLGHYVIEVAGELLSKPNALGDFLELEGFPSALVYCNTPSDTDLLEVLLKKRGIPASKLIGYVPPQKQQRAMERIMSRELCALVVTDIAARNLDLSAFDVVINYSIQNDADMYRQRCGLLPMHQGYVQGGAAEGTESESTEQKHNLPGKVVSFVGPLDLGNFHFLKKGLGIEMTSIPVPDKSQLADARAKNIYNRAVASPLSKDESYRALARLVLGQPDQEGVMAVLLHAFLEQIPQLQADVERAQTEREIMDDEGVQPGARRRDDQDFESRGGGGRGRRGGRGQRGGMGGEGRDNRGGRQGRGGDSRRHAEFSDNDESDQDFEGPNGNRGERGGSQDERSSRRPHRDVVRIKEDRIYIGRGSRDGFSENRVADLLKEHCNLEREQIKRFSLRPAYSFVDLPEEVSQNALECLKGKVADNRGEVLFTRAVTLTHSQELAADDAAAVEEGSSEDQSNGDNNDQNFEAQQEA